MEQQNQPSFIQRNSVIIKGLLIGFLSIMLLIPTLMIRALINEREVRKSEVIQEVNATWGNTQLVSGPILRVPYYELANSEQIVNGKKQIIQNKIKRLAYFLPNDLKIDGTILPEKRNRGIYQVVVYNGNLKINGSFSKVSLGQWGALPENIQWQNAQVLLTISDLRGINELIEVSWNGQKSNFEPGAILSESFKGVQAPVQVSQNNEGAKFEISLSLKGSESLKFIPIGKTTNVSLQSKWSSPSFSGTFLPDNRQIDAEKFSAQWKVLHLNRNIPQQWNDAQEVPLADSAFGVDLISPNDGYQKSDRSAKYAILIISLTFLSFFFVELLNHKRIHPFHYILVGLALCIFYTLLISISEFLRFNLAYLIATVLTIGLIFLYAKSVFGQSKLASIVSLIMLTLYSFVFIIIQLEDTALLIGSIGLFLILALTMYVSRRIDWNGLSSEAVERV
jgi:inner membrane protein